MELALAGQVWFEVLLADLKGKYNNIVTCMRFPWFNNVSTATTMG
jgi:hypothetical protein